MVDIRELYDRYCFELLESGGDDAPTLFRFVEYLKKIYPHVVRVRKILCGGKRTLYKGISLKQLQPLGKKDYLSFCDISNFICLPAVIQNCSETQITFTIPTRRLMNGIELFKTVILTHDFTWTMQIGTHRVDLSKLKVDDKFEFTKESIENIISICDRLKLCNGVAVKGSAIVHKCQTLEHLTIDENDTVRILRSYTCLRMVPISAVSETCRICQKMRIIPHEKPAEPDNIEEIRKIEHLLEHGTPELVQLFMDQSDLIDLKSSARRWSPSLLEIFLKIYNCSPKCYKILLASKMLVLPSPVTMRTYRKKLKETPVLDDISVEHTGTPFEAADEEIPGEAEHVEVNGEYETVNEHSHMAEEMELITEDIETGEMDGLDDTVNDHSCMTEEVEEQMLDKRELGCVRRDGKTENVHVSVSKGDRDKILGDNLSEMN